MINLVDFTPGLSLTGGLMIGTASAVLILFNGRIAGISGILGGLLSLPEKDVAWRAAFLIGMMLAPVMAIWAGRGIEIEIQAGWGEILTAGFLVGVGTRYAGGCTSGHGVCGISRGSVRSVAATLTFMATGFATVFVKLHLVAA